jgi:ribokinase
MQIVGLGLCTLDILMRMHAMPTWEHGGALEGLRFDGGGPVATALAAAARLGAQAGFVGTCGSDEIAALKMECMTREGIDTSRVMVRSGVETQVILVYVQAAGGERIFVGAPHFSYEPLKVSELDRDYIIAADYLHLDGFHMEAALEAARWMHAAGKRVVLDGGKTEGHLRAEMRELVALSDILICGSGFAPALTGETDIYCAGRAARRFGPSIVVQTEGEAGSFTFAAEEEFHTPAFKVDVVDTTGAGDVFHGAYLVGLLHGWDLRRIATFATAVAALKCTHLGGRAGIPRFADVVHFLEGNEQGVAGEN